MPRAPREDFEGAIHHVMGRGNDGGTLFHDRRDRQLFLDLLGASCLRYGWRCFAYCLMGTHFHLGIGTPHAGLNDGMRDLLGRYARGYNRRRGRTGHVFNNRYRCVAVRGDGQLLAVVRYIARNPVEAGLTHLPAAWEWSGYAATVGLVPPPPFLDVSLPLGVLAADPAQAALRLRDMVESESPSVDGTHPASPPVGDAASPPRPDMTRVIAQFGETAGVRECLRLGYSQSELAEALGVSQSTVSRIARSTSARRRRRMPATGG